MNVRRLVDLTLWIAGALMAAALIADASANELEHARARDARHQAECGSCHLAYPPQLLPARSWHALMATLDRHFGVDASLDATTARAIGAFLDRNAGRDRGATAPLRITETAWFVREHGEARTSSTRPKSDCAACHRSAVDGDFGERSLRVSR